MADWLLIESNGSTLEKVFIWSSLLLESVQTYKLMSCCASAEWKCTKGRTRNMKKAIIWALSWHPMFPRWDLSSQATVTWNECYPVQMRRHIWKWLDNNLEVRLHSNVPTSGHEPILNSKGSRFLNFFSSHHARSEDNSEHRVYFKMTQSWQNDKWWWWWGTVLVLLYPSLCWINAEADQHKMIDTKIN